MTLSKFVSARWTPWTFGDPDPTIIAIGDDGLEYTIPSMNSDVPPWPQYLADGGTVDPAGISVSDQITSAPDDLTGGPTLGEIFNGN